MQFITQDPELIIVDLGSRPLYDVQGNMVNQGSRRVSAKFRRGLPGWAVPEAMKLLDINRRPPDLSTEQWFAFYDSEEDQITQGWTDEERQIIEADLLKRGYDAIEHPQPAVPYGPYAKHRKIHGRRTLEHVTADISEAIGEGYCTLQSVVDYEQVAGDENSEALIEALKAQVQEPEEELIEA